MMERISSASSLSEEWSFSSSRTTSRTPLRLKIHSKSSKPNLQRRSLRDIPVHCFVQNGSKTFSFPINPRTDICNQLVIRESVSKKIFLSFKVIHLFSGRNTTVTDFFFRFRIRTATNNVLYILKIVSSYVGFSSNSTDFTFFIPDTKSLNGNL